MFRLEIFVDPLIVNKCEILLILEGLVIKFQVFDIFLSGKSKW